MVPLFQIFGPSLVPLLSKTGPLFGPSEGLFEGGTRLVITVHVSFLAIQLANDHCQVFSHQLIKSTKDVET